MGGGDKDVVKEYFNNSGFQRWKKIYGETDDVNRVQRDIRLGHSKTVENVMAMLKDEGPLTGVTVCDAGCGTGSLSIPLAKEGAIVFASDISAAMVAEAQNKVRLPYLLSPTKLLYCIALHNMISRYQFLLPNLNTIFRAPNCASVSVKSNIEVHIYLSIVKMFWAIRYSRSPYEVK